ncbi:6-bladed beta-propeller [Gemmatimonadota bacterium]
MRNLTVFMVFVTIIACSSSPGEGDYSFRVFEEDGITVAETLNGPRYSEELFLYEEIATLHEDEREDSYLVRPGNAMLGESGLIFVSDGYTNTSRIAVFNMEGVYQYSIGRGGQGPGEFRLPRLVSVEGGIVQCSDPSLNRLSRFNTDGSLIDTHPIPAGDEDFRTIHSQWIGDDRLFLFSNRSSSPNDREVFQQQAVVMEADGDTIWSHSTDSVRGGRQVVVEVEGATIYASAPRNLSGRPRIIHSSFHGILFTTGERPEIDIFDIEGVHRKRIRIDLPFEAVTAEDRRESMASLMELRDNAPSGNKAVYSAMIDHAEFPEEKAYWTGLSVEESGYIWIFIPTFRDAAGDPADGRICWILSPEGEYLGTTRTPPGSVAISRGHLISTRSDPDTGADIITVFRIRSALNQLKYPD